MNEQYIGHPDQYYGVEEHRLVGGRKDGMRIFEVRNGKGLSFTVSADRGADITRLAFMGWNFGFFHPAAMFRLNTTIRRAPDSQNPLRRAL